MNIKELNNGVAVEITDFDIRDITPEIGKQINNLVRDRTIVVLKNQTKTSQYYTKFVNSIGPVRNWMNFVFDPLTGKEVRTAKENKARGFIDPATWSGAPDEYPVQRVSGKIIDGQRSGIFGAGVLDWHAALNSIDSADGVALQGFEGCSGTSTTFLNTAIALDQMPAELLERCKDVYCEYQYSPSTWANGIPTKQLAAMYAVIGARGFYKMWLIQQNGNGRRGIYFYTNNKCKIVSSDTTLYNDLYDYLFQEKFMYQNFYEPGDIIISDQVLSLHKRDQNDPAILENRVLHRITFSLSNPFTRDYNKELNM